ncbi:MAG: CmcJ/NvfI family oxidoreductase [Rhodovibrionaceae bacterium]
MKQADSQIEDLRRGLGRRALPESSASEQAGQVTGAFNYLLFDGVKPRVEIAPDGLRYDQGMNFAPFLTKVADGRLRETPASLEREGFAFERHATALQDFTEEAIKQAYYPEMAALVKRISGASRVLVFDHNLRRDDGRPDGEEGKRQPVRRVHDDYTAGSAPLRIADLLGREAAEAITGKRTAIINVWRPLARVETAPLALAEANSVAPEDLIAADLVYPERTGEIYYAAPNPAHRWTYYPGMTREEVLLIKCYDSLNDGRARFTLHSAFDDPTTPKNAAPRQSIELRTLAVFD